MVSMNRGSTALERLREHYRQVDSTCPECGFDDADGRWLTETDGNRILYKRVCPSCGGIRNRTITVTE